MHDLLPDFVNHKLLEIINERYRTAYFKLDSKSGILLEKGGQLEAFEFADCLIGQALQERLVLLTGLLPLKDDEQLSFTALESEAGGYLDIYLFKQIVQSLSFIWVICLNRSEELSWQQMAQQKNNELELLKSSLQKDSARLNFFDLYDVLPFQRQMDGRFYQLEAAPRQIELAFPHTFKRHESIDLLANFPFLDSFIDQAEEVWADPNYHRRKKSGPWLEQLADGREIPMEATAIGKDGKKLLLLELLDEHYEEQLNLLQMGREEALLREQADIANREKSKFLASMSHELKTPLNIIIGFTDLCLKLSIKNQSYLEKILIASKNLLGLIDNILDFSKLKAGRLDLEYSDFDLHRELTELEDMFSYLAREKAIQLNMSWARDVPQWLHGDSLRLKQILINLIANALKFTHTGSVEIEVNRVSQSDTEITLNFSITDSGIGISQEKQRKIFAAFVQAESSTTREYGGTGLGLAICKQLVEQMGGNINLRSELGKGSVFVIQIPFKMLLSDIRLMSSSETYRSKKNQVVEFKSNKKDNSGSIPRVDNFSYDLQYEQEQCTRLMAGKHILLVDDDSFNQELIRELLKPYAVVMEVVDNGLTAVARVISGNYDCVLMDINMPIMGGYEATRIIRENPDCQQIPIIALTANTASEEIEKCHHAGMNDYLNKPIQIKFLIHKLAGCIAAKNMSNKKKNQS